MGVTLVVTVLVEIYGYGNMSESNNSPVNQNTIFAIGSNIKVFTATLLADLVKIIFSIGASSLIRYLPSNVTVPEYIGHKVTVKDLATPTSSLS